MSERKVAKKRTQSAVYSPFFTHRAIAGRLLMASALLTLLPNGCKRDTPKLSEAPDFELAGLDQKKVSLSDYHGKPVLLAFWAYD